MSKKTKVAICYDFDGTLSPGNMQEYGFFSNLGSLAKNFWSDSKTIVKESGADPILAYMKLMIDRADQGKIKTTRKAFREYGNDIKFYKGVEEWFKRINEFGAKLDLEIEHYIVSSGLKEMIEGTSIAKNFEKIYACSFLYTQNDVATWPAVAVNYTTKTQFLFRINKGIIDDTDHVTVNQYIPEEERRIPFSRMLYIGDGETDVPCMKLVKDKGGTSIALYPPKTSKKRKQAAQLLIDKRVNFIAPAIYTDGARLDSIIKQKLEHIQSGMNLCKLSVMSSVVKKNANHKDQLK